MCRVGPKLGLIADREFVQGLNPFEAKLRYLIKTITFRIYKFFLNLFYFIFKMLHTWKSS